jgi:PST family polysaccharide transporter
MAMSGFGGWSLVVQRLVEIGVNSCFALLAAKWRPRAWPSRSHFLLMRGLGPQVVTLRSLMLVLGQTPTVALGVFADARAAGLFALAWRLAEIVRALIIKPMEGVAQSAFAMLRRKQTATASFFLDVNEIVALGALTSFVGLALIGEPLVGVLLGADWRESGLVLPFLCIAGSASALTAIQQSYLLAVGRLGPFMLALLLEAAIGIVLIALAGPHGPVIVAAAVALRAVCCLPFYVSAALAPEKISLREYLNSLSAPAIVATAILVVVGLLRLGASGYLPDAVFVPLAITLGGVTAWVVLLAMMPKLLSRLKTFLTE